MNLKRWFCVIAGAAMVAAPVSLLAQSASFYRLRLEDKKAVYLTRNDGGLHGDGVADDTDAIQAAINKVQETTGQGIVFVPDGRYRLSKTVFILSGTSGNWKYLDNEHEGRSMVLAWQTSPMVCRFTQRGCFAFRPSSTSRRMTLNPGPHLLGPYFG